MLEFEYLNPIHHYRPIVVTFYIEEEGDYRNVARFRFKYEAFDSMESALSIFAGLVGNNFVIESSFGYMSVCTDEDVYYGDVRGVIGHAEVKNFGNIFDEHFNIELFYPESISVDEIYRLIDEDLDLKSYKFNVEQLFEGE